MTHKTARLKQNIHFTFMELLSGQILSTTVNTQQQQHWTLIQGETWRKHKNSQPLIKDGRIYPHSTYLISSQKRQL